MAEADIRRGGQERGRQPEHRRGSAAAAQAERELAAAEGEADVPGGVPCLGHPGHRLCGAEAASGEEGPCPSGGKSWVGSLGPQSAGGQEAACPSPCALGLLRCPKWPPLSLQLCGALPGSLGIWGKCGSLRETTQRRLHPLSSTPPRRLPSLDEARRPGGVQGAHWPVLRPQLWLPAPCSLPVATTPVLEVMKMHLSAGRRPLLSVISFSLSGTPAGAAGRKGGIIGSRFVELMGKQTQEEGALSLSVSLCLSHAGTHTHTRTEPAAPPGTAPGGFTCALTIDSWWFLARAGVGTPQLRAQGSVHE